MQRDVGVVDLVRTAQGSPCVAGLGWTLGGPSISGWLSCLISSRRRRLRVTARGADVVAQNTQASNLRCQSDSG